MQPHEPYRQTCQIDLSAPRSDLVLATLEAKPVCPTSPLSPMTLRETGGMLEPSVALQLDMANAPTTLTIMHNIRDPTIVVHIQIRGPVEIELGVWSVTCHPDSLLKTGGLTYHRVTQDHLVGTLTELVDLGMGPNLPAAEKRTSDKHENDLVLEPRWHHLEVLKTSIQSP